MKYSQYASARLKELKRQLKDKAEGRDPRVLIPTGLKAMDKLGGIQRGILTLVGAATGQGKSVFVAHMMEAAARAGYTVEVWSFEDPPERTVDRSLSKLTNINNADIYKLNVDEDQLAQIEDASDEIEEWGDNITFHAGLMDADETIEAMRESEADFRIIDYVQSFPGNELERTIANFTWEANKIAQDDGCAVLAMSQVNTAKVEERGLRILERSLQRDDSKPNVSGFAPWGASDLAWCSAAGQRAKELLFLYRPNYYLRRAGVAVRDDRMVITGAKNSFSAEGAMTVGFDGRTARLFDLKD